MSSKKSFNSYDLSIVCKRAYPICAIWRVLKANNRSISRVYGLKSTFAPQPDVKFRGEIAISVNVIVFFPTIHGFSPLPLGSIVRMHPTKWTSRQSSAFSAQAFSFSKSKKTRPFRLWRNGRAVSFRQESLFWFQLGSLARLLRFSCFGKGFFSSEAELIGLSKWSLCSFRGITAVHFSGFA